MRPEDGKAGAAPVAYRGIDEAVHVTGERDLRERVADGIAERRIGIERGMFARLSEVAIFAGEAREQFGVIDDGMEVARAPEEGRHVERHFGERGLDGERR